MLISKSKGYIQIGSTKLELNSFDAEPVYSLNDIPIKVNFHATGIQAAINKVKASLGIPPTGTIVESSLVEPITDESRLIDAS